MLDNIIATIVVSIIIGGALTYIIRAKKGGQKCIGCPHSKVCSSKNNSCDCGCNKEK